MRINCEQLILARQLRQLTQKEVAEQTGISQGKLSKAEHGIQDLSNDAINSLANFYDFPISFFVVEKDNSPISHQYFRRRLTLPVKVLEAFIAKTQIYKMCIDTLLQDVDLPEMQLPYIQTSETLTPSEIAKKIRYVLRVYRGPVPNLTTLLENNGIVIIKFDFGTDKLDGLTSFTNNEHIVIFLNSAMPNDRTRFSLAHELGHLIMHMKCSPNEDVVEDEADEFASEFLMPKDEIEPYLYNIDINTLIQLKRKWQVSMRALIRRAKDLETISHDQYRNLQILFSKRHYNKREPMPLHYEPTNTYKYTIQLHKDDLGYSDKELASIMHLNPRDYLEFINRQLMPSFILCRK